MEKVCVAPGIFWVDIPESDLRVLCGCPADSVKHLIRHGLISTTRRNGVSFETGPNAILLSDTPAQKGGFANLCEFPLLQMFYRQGMLLPGHPNNTGRKPMLIGLTDQVRAQAEYVFRGNYGLQSLEEIVEAGVPRDRAEEMMAVKKWFAFGAIRSTEELVQIKAVDMEAVELVPGVVVHRKGFNLYELLGPQGSVEVDLTLGPAEEYQPAYTLPPRTARREPFSVIHVGEGDGWDVGRPCIGSIVCCDGLLYLVDAGPHITHTLDALGIGLPDLEGVFQTHAHDDHFAGLTSLGLSERRLKYFAVPYVRASVQKKMAALMRFEERRFESFFEVHDLRPDEWNGVGGMEVRPLYSPHPVETTVFFFRCGRKGRRRTYSHLADIPSSSVLAKLAAPGKSGPAFPEKRRDAFLAEVLAPAEVKKVDVGGGLIHGDAADFAADGSARLLLSHGIASVPAGMPGTAVVAGFGERDVLIQGGASPYLLQTARSCLSHWFPGCIAEEIDGMALCPVVEVTAGGIAEETDAGVTRRLTTGSFAAGLPWHESPGARCTAVSDVTVLSIPDATYRDFMSRRKCIDALRLTSARRDVLHLCPLFSDIRSEKALNAIAASMRMFAIPGGAPAPSAREPTLFLLVEGELDLAMGDRLVESLRPGGFWSEETIVATAPTIVMALAVTDCSCAAIPAEALAEIPVVQWELLETFERRLRSFRAGFEFTWTDSYKVNVTEMDDQHRTLFGLVNELSLRIGVTGTVSGHDALKGEILEQTRKHFQSEEQLMESNSYPRLAVQKAEHVELLQRLQCYLGAEERPTRPRTETMIDYLKDWLIRHTLMEDLKYRDFFAEKGIR